MGESITSSSSPKSPTGPTPRRWRTRCAPTASAPPARPMARRSLALPSPKPPSQAAMSQLLRRKSVADCEADIAERGGLKRTLNKWHLTALGVGATIGAGIFASTGNAIVGDPARPGAGPAIVLSFLLTAVACGFAALCYAEFAAMVPVSGSAYTYAYASLGEFVAWIIGWDLIIEYAVGNIGVAIGWSGYFRELMGQFGGHMPAWLSTDPRSAHMAAAALAGGATDATTTFLASAVTGAPVLL